MSDTSVRTERIEHPESPVQKEDVLIALAGQPNVGKSTVFNLLTGLNQHVGNWPGKTVERKVGVFRHKGTTYRIVDLPGTYSLTASSAEEVVAREFIIKENPDLVVALVDAANLERSLYLIAELLPLRSPVIVALNMMDVAKQEGYEIEPQVLEAALGVPVVPLIATKNVGMQELVDTIDEIANDGVAYQPKRPDIRQDHQQVLSQIEELIGGCVPDPYPEDWVSLKLLEGDEKITEMMQQCTGDKWREVYEILRAHDDALMAVASGRYEWIERMMRAAVTRPKAGQIGLTARVDRWATHPFWGILLLAGVLAVSFGLTYAVGTPLQDLLDTYLVSGLAASVETLLSGAPVWLVRFLTDGVIAGAGTVLTFLPILVIFFAVMATLEDVGYMARAAYVMDSFMHLMGLHGKSFLPLFLGFGCNVPAVLGSRVIESRRARLLTIFLAPLVPCTARLAVVAFLAPAFFGSSATLVSWGLILLSLLVLAVSGVLINRTVFKGERAAFIMELPLYHQPNWQTIGTLVWQRSVSFVQKAGTVILPISVLVWALSMFPGGRIESSILARLGRLIQPLGAPMGFDWRLMVALLSSFIAKENSIATLGVLFGAESQAGLSATLASALSLPTATAFLVVQMLFVPCVATVAAVRQETGSLWWTIANVGFLLVVSWGGGIAIYWIVRLIEGGL